ncbi:MAG: hypothetical protein ABI647_01185 [Gemmatimonadota bacterium]
MGGPGTKARLSLFPSPYCFYNSFAGSTFNIRIAPELSTTAAVVA